jgi:Uma2 family endonuclease
LLVIEVSDSTLAYDRQIKRPLYAKSGIPEYWLVNLIDNTIEVHRQPEGGNYQERFVADRQQKISAVAFSDVTFQVAGLIR